MLVLSPPFHFLPLCAGSVLSLPLIQVSGETLRHIRTFLGNVVLLGWVPPQVVELYSTRNRLANQLVSIEDHCFGWLISESGSNVDGPTVRGFASLRVGRPRFDGHLDSMDGITESR